MLSLDMSKACSQKGVPVACHLFVFKITFFKEVRRKKEGSLDQILNNLMTWVSCWTHYGIMGPNSRAFIMLVPGDLSIIQNPELDGYISSSQRTRGTSEMGSKIGSSHLELSTM